MNKKNNNKKKSFDYAALKPLAMLSHFGMIIILPLIAGIAIGGFLDAKLGTKPLLLIVFMLIFLLSGMMNLYRTAMKLSAKNEESKSGNESRNKKDAN